MMIVFKRDTAGFPYAQASEPSVEVLAGLLSSDVSDASLARELMANLTHVQDTGQPWEGTGNAYTVESKGQHSRVEFAIDESIAPVDLPTPDLVALLASWEAFLARGTPTSWATV